MNRRDLLGAGGAVFAAGALAGCSALLDEAPDGDTDDASNRRTTARRTERQVVFGDGSAEAFRWLPGGETVVDATVGDPSAVPFPENTEPVSLRLWNDATSRRTLRVTVYPGDGTRSLWSRHVTFGPGDVARLSLVEPREYEALVVANGARVGRLLVAGEAFDCNATTVNVRVSDGDLQFFAESTDVGCAEPSVDAVTVEERDATCGSRDQAWVTVADGTIRLDGKCRVPDGCHAVTGATATYEPAHDRVVTVVRTAATGGDCDDCTTTIGYDAVLEMANGYPETLLVEHAVDGRTREVEVVRNVATGRVLPETGLSA